METMGLNPDFWRDKRVFVTGHSGFKGNWLCLWLRQMGCIVTGYSLAADLGSNLFAIARTMNGMTSHIGDIRDQKNLSNALEKSAAEIIFHLAAQPLVRTGYQQPVNTLSTNIMGTAHLLEAARVSHATKVIQIITTDKVYKNREWLRPYGEDDTLGGHDPYSTSKAACELVAAGYRQSFLVSRGISISTARAGNVIGGGDWAVDRLLPDCIRAFVADKPVALRQPAAVRPWQHVLEPLMGYLILAQHQWQEAHSHIPPDEWRFARAFNFGPDASAKTTVGDIANHAAAAWGEQAKIIVRPENEAPHEAGLLTLDSGLAKQMLGWQVRWPVKEAIKQTIDWYRRQRKKEGARELCLEQISGYQQYCVDA